MEKKQLTSFDDLPLIMTVEELAPILGLSDVIVDIVETGKTLLENNLEPVETVVPISARLIANKSALKFKTEQIEAIRKGLMKGLAEQND